MTMEATMAVLILVLMEYKWNKKDMGSPQMGMDCLNPCFNGIQMEHILYGRRTSPITS